LLPHTGVWMTRVTRFFGVLMLALALWIVSPVVPGWMPMLGWAVLAAGFGMYLLSVKGGKVLSKTLGLLFAVMGGVQLVGVISGGRDPLAPLDHLTASGNHKTAFMHIKSVAQLDAVLAQAHGKTAMLDFYADWCVSCKEMEKLTFSDRRVQTQFDTMLLLQVDVTANDDDDKAMLKRFNLFGPPGIIFFDKQGKEINGGRVIGYQDTEKFLHTLNLITGF
jgi:thioredoxin:protein disulfide reductase